MANHTPLPMWPDWFEEPEKSALHPAFDPSQWAEPVEEPPAAPDGELLAGLTLALFSLRDEIREQNTMLARLVFILSGEDPR